MPMCIRVKCVIKTVVMYMSLFRVQMENRDFIGQEILCFEAVF